MDFDIPDRGQGLKINLQWISKNDCLIMKELDNRNNSYFIIKFIDCYFSFNFYLHCLSFLDETIILTK